MHKDALLLETGRSSSLPSIIHVKYQEERSLLARKWQQTCAKGPLWDPDLDRLSLPFII